MSFKTFIKNLLAFLKDLFGDDKKETTTVQPSTTTKPATKPATNPIHPSVGIIDPSEFSYYFGEYSTEEQIKIRKLIDDNAAKGILNYPIETSKRIYYVIEGTKIYESTEGHGKPRNP